MKGKSIRLALANWKVLVKSLLCQFLVMAIIIALAFTVFGGLVEDIVQAFSGTNFLEEFVKKTYQSITDGTFNNQLFIDDLQVLMDQFSQIIESIPNLWQRVELSYIAFLLILGAYRILIAYPDIASCYQLDEFMTSNAVRPFTWYLVKKQGKTWKFAFGQFVISTMLDLLVISGVFGIYIIFFSAMKWWTVFIAILIGLALYALKQSWFSLWLPSVVANDSGVREGLKDGLSKIPYRIWSVFWRTFLTMLGEFVIVIVSFLFIKSPLVSMLTTTLTGAMAFFLLKCINMVQYYEACQKPYFFKVVEIQGTERYNKKHKTK